MKAPGFTLPEAGQAPAPTSVELLDRIEHQALALGVLPGLAPELELLRLRLTQDHYRGAVLEAELAELRGRVDGQRHEPARRRWFGRRRPSAAA